MRGGQPCRTGVVEVGQRSRLQFGFGGVGRVQPLLTQVVRLVRGVSNSVQPRIAPFLLRQRTGKGKVSKQIVGV